MIQSFRAWLPATALQADQFEDRLSQAVGEWSRKWFARRPMLLTGGEGEGGSSGRKRTISGPWRALDEGLGLAVASDGHAAIAAALLDLSREDKVAAGGDEAILERLALGCLDDLKARLCRLLGLPADSAWHRDLQGGAPDTGTQVWSIGIDGQSPVAWLGADQELFVRLAKLGVSVVPEAFELRPLREGLARQPVQVSAFLGSCELTLSDLASLAPGDVVVLDRAHGDPLELSVGPSDRSGRCVVEQEGEQFLLKIVRPFFE